MNQMHLLQGVTFIYITVCVFHWPPHLISEELNIFRAFHFQDIPQAVLAQFLYWSHHQFAFEHRVPSEASAASHGEGFIGFFCPYRFGIYFTEVKVTLSLGFSVLLLQLWSCRPDTLPVFTRFSPSISCLQAVVLVIWVLRLVPTRSQNNAHYRKTDGQSWPGIFPLPLMEICKVFFKKNKIKSHILEREGDLKGACSGELFGVFNSQTKILSQFFHFPEFAFRWNKNPHFLPPSHLSAFPLVTS